ncbi:MAG: MFS transporter [Firmicutes bacterium]|nr:MFS transporter [Bacillota bacterium]
MQRSEGIIDRHARFLLGMVSFCGFVAMVPNSAILPTLPALADHYGVGLAEGALLVSTFTLAYTFATPFAGVLSDRLGPRPVLFFSLLLFAVAGMLPLVGLPFSTVLVLRAVMGIGGAGMLSTAMALVGDSFRGEALFAASATLAAAQALGDAIIPPVGGFLGQIDPLVPFTLYGLAFVAAGWVLWVRPKNPVREPSVKPLAMQEYIRAVRLSLSDPVVRTICLIWLVLLAAYFALLTLLPGIVSMRLHANGLFAGLLMAVIGVTWTGGTQLSRLMARTVGTRRLLGPALALFAFAVPGTVVAPNLPLLIAFLVLVGLSAGCADTLLTHALLHQSLDGTRGLVSSVVNAFSQIGLSLGAGLAALLAIHGNVFGVLPWTVLLLGLIWPLHKAMAVLHQQRLQATSEAPA